MCLKGRELREIDEIVGKCIFDYTSTESVRYRKAAIDKIFRTGDPLQLEDIGQTAIFDTHIHPVFNPAGEVTAVTVYAHDITERKAAEEQLKKTTKLLQSVMDNATDEAIITTDRMGIILIWNEGAKRLLGYESEEVVGRESIRIFHTEEYLKSGIMDVNIKKMIATRKPLIQITSTPGYGWVCPWVPWSSCSCSSC